MRRSGVSPATLASNTARLTPRRSACGQSPSRQLRKLAAAVRIACGGISGWLDAPDSPLHSGAGVGAAGTTAGTAPVVARGADGARMSRLCPNTGGASAAMAKTAPDRRISRANVSMCSYLGSIVGSPTLGNPNVAGPLNAGALAARGSTWQAGCSERRGWREPALLIASYHQPTLARSWSGSKRSGSDLATTRIMTHPDFGNTETGLGTIRVPMRVPAPA